ncbi:ATP-binding response regulator [Rhodopirellula sallentina]|uniref:Response regulator receiver protein n=1 Tax=Rhodopirellula sallentina SM41 TaxID=1263870 RepID=M5UBW7_9BACT|nr:response regulator [Rhodopirellula sallentina]EMI53498.1 response regulator receiver protein [Rhodopirellula sallentina SM41]
MTKILIVDDNEMDRVLAGHLLTDHYELTYASDGAKGLEAVVSENPDLVVTDMNMPKMDGMSLLTELQKQRPEIPVIMITSEGSELAAAEALDRGASSYVPKSCLPERLSETVDQLVDLMRADREYVKLLERLTYCKYTYVLENDFSLIDPLVEFIQQIAFAERLCDHGTRGRLGVAINEALFNAMYHGNLELPIDGMQAARNLMRAGLPIPNVQERRKDSEYEQRRVVVDITISLENMRIIIEDDGNGFDHERYRRESDRTDTDLHRGILLIESIMDTVIFNETGNKLTLIKHRQTPADKLEDSNESLELSVQ